MVSKIYWYTFIHNTGVLTIIDLRKVQRATWEARVKWYNIGLELEIDPGTLDTIKTDNENSDDRFRAMLMIWLKMVQPKPTLAALAEALQSPTVGFEHLAEQVQALKWSPMHKNDFICMINNFCLRKHSSHIDKFWCIINVFIHYNLKCHCKVLLWFHDLFSGVLKYAEWYRVDKRHWRSFPFK